MKKDSYCNKPAKYFEGNNLSDLYNLYSEKLSFDLSRYIEMTEMDWPYQKYWKQLKGHNGNLYNQIRAIAEVNNSVIGDIETKMFFITGRQFYSDIRLLTIDQKSKLISVINMFLRKSIGNPTMKPIIWNPRDMKNNGVLQIANAHNIGNLRTGVNHLINERVIKIKWANYINNDFVSSELDGYPKDNLHQYLVKVQASLSKPDEIAKTDRCFGFERIVRDIIRTDLQGINVKSLLIPTFNLFVHYKHNEFETDILAETSSQRWIIEISTGHKSSNEIIKKFYKRKKHFNETKGELPTIGLFIVSNHGILINTKDIIVLTISEFVEILKENNIRDTISCFNFK